MIILPRRACAILLALTVVASSHASQGRAPRPDAASIAATDDAFEKLLKPKYQAARKHVDKARLARELAGMAREAGGDHAMRWVLLERARALAGGAGDFELHALVLDEQCASFEVDDLATRLAAWEQYAAATRGSKDKVMLSRLADRLEELRAEAAATAGLDEARLVLRRDPADGAANALVGRHECFDKREWASGLAHLARGDDEELAELAARDLSEPEPHAERMDLGLAWIAWAESRKGAQREAALERGRRWLGRAWEGSDAAQRERIVDALRRLWLRRPQAQRELLEGKWSEVGELPTPKDTSVGALAVSADQRLAATTHWKLREDRKGWEPLRPQGRIWDLARGKQLAEFDLGMDHAGTLRFSPDGGMLLVEGSTAGKSKVSLLSMPSGATHWTVDSSGGHDRQSAFGLGGRTLLLVAEATIEEHDIATRRRERVLLSHEALGPLEASPDGRRLAAWNPLGVLECFDMRSASLEVQMRDSDFQPQALAWVGSDWILTGDRQVAGLAPGDQRRSQVRLWDAIAGVLIARMPSAGLGVDVLRPSNAGIYVAVHGYTDTPFDGVTMRTQMMNLVRLDTGASLPRPQAWEVDNPPPQLAFLADGKVLGADRMGGLKVWAIAPR